MRSTPTAGAKIVLTGTADSFSTVALQSDQFGASKVLKDIIFSNIGVQDGGAVSFTVSASIDPSLILYKNVIASGGRFAGTGSSRVSIKRLRLDDPRAIII